MINSETIRGQSYRTPERPESPAFPVRFIWLYFQPFKLQFRGIGESRRDLTRVGVASVLEVDEFYIVHVQYVAPPKLKAKYNMCNLKNTHRKPNTSKKTTPQKIT